MGVTSLGACGWLYPSELAAVSVLTSKGKAGDGDPGAALPRGASASPRLAVPSLQPPQSQMLSTALAAPSHG